MRLALNLQRLLIPVSLILAIGCENKSDSKTELPVADDDAKKSLIESEPLALSGSLSLSVSEIDQNDVTLQSFNSQNQSEQDSTLGVRAYGKALSARPGWVWLELFIENKTARSLEDLSFEVSTDSTIVDVTTNPFAEAALDGAIQVGGIGPYGLGHVALAIPEGLTKENIKLEYSVEAKFTNRTTTTSSAMTRIGDRIWSAHGDYHQVSVIDSNSNKLVTNIPFNGKPESLAATADGRFVVVVESRSNTVSLVNTQDFTIVQTLGEAEGIARNPRGIVADNSSSRFFLSSYVDDKVQELILNEKGQIRLGETLQVGRRPLGLSLSQNGQNLFVSHYLPRGNVQNNEVWVSVIDTKDNLRLLHEAVSEDIGNKERSKCLANRYGTDQSLLMEGIATQLAAVYLMPGGQRGLIPGAKIGPTVLFEGRPGLQIPGMGRFTFSPGFIFALDASQAAKAEFRRNSYLLDYPDANLDFLKCANFELETEATVPRSYQENADLITNNGAAVPTPATGLAENGLSRVIGYSKGARRALALSYIADEVQILDPLTMNPGARANAKLSGSNPIAVSFNKDKTKAFVLYENSSFISILDVSALADTENLPSPQFVKTRYERLQGPPQNFVSNYLMIRDASSVDKQAPVQEVGQIAVIEKDPLAAEVRRGKVLFTSSSPEKYPDLTASKQAACATCHPNGGHDGTVWATMEGERRTLSLYGGVAGRGWLHQSGTHQDITAFTDDIVKERLGGSGLSKEDEESLAEYIARHIEPLQTPTVDQNSAARGEMIFKASCAGCHAGEKFTGGRPDPENRWGGGIDAGPLLVDVGTATTTAGGILPNFFTDQLPPIAAQLYDQLRGDRTLGDDDPVQEITGFYPRPNRPRGQLRPTSLVAAWDYAAIFHDGRYGSLEEAVDYFLERFNTDLSDQERTDLITYLKTL